MAAMGSLYGFEVKTDMALRRLNAAPGTRGELTVAAATGRLAFPGVEPASEVLGEDGRRVYASYALDSGECLVELPPVGTFLLQPAANEVVAELDGGDDELAEHRVASSAICTLLALRGDLVLHASAVEVGGRAAIFCGPTRRGKSTLVRALGEGGYPILGEDGIAIELGGAEPVAYPGARGVRVRKEGPGGAPRTELLADPGPGEPAPCPAAAVVLIDKRGARLAVEPLDPARAVALLTPSLVHAGDRASIAAAFSRLATLLRTVPAFRASLPDGLDRLGVAAEELLTSTGIRG